MMGNIERWTQRRESSDGLDCGGYSKIYRWKALIVIEVKGVGSVFFVEHERDC